MTWRAPLSVKCLFCHEAKEHPKVATMSKQGRYCILCYVEEDVSICRKCLVPWRADYDSNNAFYEEVLRFARAEDEPHMLCLECVREDKANRKRLTLPAWALDVKARLQLQKIRKVVAKFGPHPIQVIASQTLDLKQVIAAGQGAASSAQGAASGAQGAASSAQGAERQPATQITTTTLFVHPRITEVAGPAGVDCRSQKLQDRASNAGPAGPAGPA